MNRMVAALASISLVAVLLTGALRPAADTRPLWLFLGLDRSKSDIENLGANAHRAANLSASLLERDHLVVYRVDYQNLEIYDNQAPGDLEKFKMGLARTLKPEPERNGTRPALFFDAVARRIAQDVPKGAAIAVTLFWDGGNDDEGQNALLDGAVTRMAQDDRVAAVTLLGVKPRFKDGLRQRFAPLGARLRVHGSEDLDIGQLAEELHNLRL